MYREVPRVDRPFTIILPVDMSMRAECMHAKKLTVTGNLLLSCTVLRFYAEFPGAYDMFCMYIDGTYQKISKAPES